MSWQDELPAKCEEFFKEFGINYAKYFGVSMLKKALAEKDKTDPKKLTYRKPSETVRPKLKEGFLFIREGEGPGSLGGWKQVYAKERNDFNLDLFRSDKDAQKPSARPMKTIFLAGYKLEANPEEYFKQAGEKIGGELECDPVALNLSKYSWALVHPVRVNYVIQCHKGSGGGACGCIGGSAVESEDMGAEFVSQREEWIQFLEDAIPRSSPRDVRNDVMSMTFAKTLDAMVVSIDTLADFKGDGTEGEILNDMIFLAVFEAACKADILEEIKKMPPQGFLRIPAWYKMRGIAATLMSKIVAKAWDTLQDQMRKLAEKIQEKMAFVLEKKEELLQLIKDKTIGTLTDMLGKHINPYLKPVFDALDKPMQKGFQGISKGFADATKKAVAESGQKRAAILDAFAADPACTKEIKDAANELVTPLEKVKGQLPEVLQDLDIDAVKKSALELMLSVMDAACYTLKMRLEAGQGSEEEIVKAVTDDLNSDINFQRATWVKTAINGTLLRMFHRQVDPHILPAIEPLQESIPEEIRDIINIKAEFDNLVDGFIADPVSRLVDSAYNVK